MCKKINGSQLLVDEDWDSIASRIISFQIEFETDNMETRKLHKRLGVIKQTLHHNVKRLGKNDAIDASLLIGTIKTVEKIEKLFEKEGIQKRREFVLFLKLILEKLKKQKLITSKPMEKQMQFKKLKRVVEHGNNTVRKSKKN